MPGSSSPCWAGRLHLGHLGPPTPPAPHLWETTLQTRSVGPVVTLRQSVHSPSCYLLLSPVSGSRGLLPRPLNVPCREHGIAGG